LVAAGLLAVGCADDAGTTSNESGSSSSRSAAIDGDGSPTFAGLCEAISAADAGDLGSVRAVFDHGPLHELAQAAEADDRGVSARLLEAKERVESDLANDTPAQQVAEDLRVLADATRAAQGLVGDSVLSNCQSEEP
jgi:hypothetical protein